MTDYIFLANGNVERHVVSLADAVELRLGEENIFPIQVEGKEYGDWVVLDYFTWMIHLFVPSMRQKYQLDRLWSDGEVLDIESFFSCEKRHLAN